MHHCLPKEIATTVAVTQTNVSHYTWCIQVLRSHYTWCIQVLRSHYTWCIQVLRSPIFFSGMEAGRNVKVVGDDVAILYVG